MFTDHELELLISGLPEIDVDDLRANTDYTGERLPALCFYLNILLNILGGER